MATISNPFVLESLLQRFRQTPSELLDARTGSNQQHSTADAPATFCFQSPSFLDCRRRLPADAPRSRYWIALLDTAHGRLPDRR